MPEDILKDKHNGIASFTEKERDCLKKNKDLSLVFSEKGYVESGWEKETSMPYDELSRWVKNADTENLNFDESESNSDLIPLVMIGMGVGFSGCFD